VVVFPPHFLKNEAKIVVSLESLRLQGRSKRQVTLRVIKSKY